MYEKKSIFTIINPNSSNKVWDKKKKNIRLDSLMELDDSSIPFKQNIDKKDNFIKIPNEIKENKTKKNFLKIQESTCNNYKSNIFYLTIIIHLHANVIDQIERN